MLTQRRFVEFDRSHSGATKGFLRLGWFGLGRPRRQPMTIGVLVGFFSFRLGRRRRRLTEFAFVIPCVRHDVTPCSPARPDCPVRPKACAKPTWRISPAWETPPRR